MSEFDFHVEFPIKEENENNSDTDDLIWDLGQGQEGDKEKQVVIVLLGWAGSKNKWLQKYSDIYLKRGCIVVRYITPVSALFVTFGKLPIYANRLIRTLESLQLDKHPIFFHVFSNGGSMMYSSILRELYKMRGQVTFDLRGTVFDSAPSPRELGKCFIACKNIFASLGLFKYLIASLAVLSIILYIFWEHFKAAVSQCLFGEQLSSLDPVRYKAREIPLRNWLGRLCKMKNHYYLFIYSDNDDLIPWNNVEEFADITESQDGNVVVMKKFLGSRHVLHYREYPEEYIQAVKDFIRFTMKTKTSPTILSDII